MQRALKTFEMPKNHSCANTNTFCTLKNCTSSALESVLCIIMYYEVLSKKPRIGGNVFCELMKVESTEV